MVQSIRTFVIFSLLCAVWVTTADGFPRRFFRRSSSNYSYSNGSSGIKTVATTVDSASAQYPALSGYFSYDKGMDERVAFTDRIRVSMLLRDSKVVKEQKPVIAEVKLTDLSNQAATCVKYFPVSLEAATGEYKLATFDVTNTPEQESIVRPAKVYRLYINLHRQGDRYGKETVLGKMSKPYYVATADDSRLGRARQHIAMRTFKEFYFAENGWRSEEQYPMDCYAYYMWATGSCTVGAQNGRTILDRLFGSRRPYSNGSAIRNLARQGAIHGDYVRIPGHSFMLLAYDEKAGHVWTMEGNFNSTIEIVIRSVDPGWTVGHLVEEHVRPNMFQVSRAETDHGSGMRDDG